MANRVLTEVKEIENEADNIKASAQSEGKNIIKSASAQAGSEVDDALKKAKKISSEIIKAKRDEAQQDSRQLLENERKEIAAMKNIDAERVRKAVDFIIERIVKPDGSH